MGSLSDTVCGVGADALKLNLYRSFVLFEESCPQGFLKVKAEFCATNSYSQSTLRLNSGATPFVP